MAIALKRFPDVRRLATLTLLCIGAASLAPAAAQERAAARSDLVLYRLKAGDNLYDLAARYFARVESYAAVQRLNAIADPRRLRPGALIRIPRSLLRHEPLQAVVQSYRGTVSIQRGTTRRAIAVGMRLAEGDLLETAEKSFVSLRLPDDSTVAMPSRSSVRIQRLRRTLLADTIDRLFVILKGRASASVTHMDNPDSRFEMSTPIAVSAVRGTEFRVQFDPDAQRATTEVTEGKVVFTPSDAAADTADRAQLVPQGYGTASDIAVPVALLPAPDFLRPGQVQDAERLSFELRPVEGAVRYHVQVAQDAGFLDLIDEADVATPVADLPPLADGSYFVRATAIDARGLEGMPVTYGFERNLNRVEADVEHRRGGRHREYLFRWRTPDAPAAQYRFQLFGPSEIDPIVDEAGLKSTNFIVTDLPDGHYRWRVMTLKFANSRVYESWSSFQELRVASGR